MGSIKIFFFKHWKLIVKVMVACVFLVLIINGASAQMKNIDFFEVSREVRSLPNITVLFLAIFGLLAAASMTLYDYSIIHYFDHTIRPALFFNIAFVANSLNNLLGIGGLAGATARTVLLRKNNLSLNVAIYYNVLLTPATPTGLSLLAVWLLLRGNSVTKEILSRYPWILIGLFAVMAILPAYFFSNRIIERFQKKEDRLLLHRSVMLKAKLVAISLVEWMAAFLFFRFVCQIYDITAPFGLLLAVYSIAAIAGIMSFLPGGIGSFDLVALIGLQLVGAAASDAFTILILFRIFFFFLPAFLGIFFLVFNLTMDRNEKLFTYSYLTNLGIFNHMIKYYKTFSDFINVLLSILVFSSGIVLLASAIKPGIPSRIDLLLTCLTPAVLNFFQVTSIVIGFLLCVLSVEILYKVKRSYRLSLWLLSLGGIFTFMKGLDFEEGLFLLAVILLIRISKPSFYRYSIPVRLSKMMFFAAIGLVGILSYFTISEWIHVEFLQHNYFAGKAAEPYGGIFLQSLITFTIFSVFLVFLYRKKPRMEGDVRFEDPDFERLSAFLEQKNGDNFAHLLYLGDKQFFWAADGAVLIPYAKYRNLIVVLGDPMGEPSLLTGAIQEFQEYLDRYGYEAVFYEVSNRNLSTYHENGYYFFKLGEEAIIDLDNFHMNGAAWSKLRHTCNSFDKKQYHFTVQKPPYEADFLAECKQISDEWLGGRKEMGFSLGWFNEEYLQKSEIATLRNPEGILLALISLMPSYDAAGTMSTDLMRIRKSVPHGTMDYLFVSLIRDLKEKGYHQFNLGMAPLSNVGLAPKSHINEKLAKHVFSYGKFFYSFEGLRTYKEKFDPVWKPRYLAYPQLLSLPATILELSMLISSEKKLSVKKRRA